jgi:hypothetical protein
MTLDDGLYGAIFIQYIFVDIPSMVALLTEVLLARRKT